MRPHRSRAAVAAVAFGAVVALAGCDAIDGDALDGRVGGVFDGDVVASAYDGEVQVDREEYVELVRAVDGDAYDDLTGESPLWETAIARQREILTVLFVQEMLAHAAERDFGVTVTDADVQAAIDEAVDEAGGREAYEEGLEAAGSSPELARFEQRWTLVGDRLEEQFPEPDAETGQDPAQEWRFEVIQEADPKVASRFGTWNPGFLRIDEAGTVDQAGTGG